MKNKILAVVLTLASHAVFAGTIINGDFSDGLNGWTTNGPVSVTGDGFAQLRTGLGAGVYTTLAQTLHLSAGDVVSGSAEFFSPDGLPFNDDAYVSLGNIDLFYASVATAGPDGDTGLVNFSYTVAAAGDYVLMARVANQLDNLTDSTLLAGRFAVASNDGPGADVPEPASVALLGLGLLGVAAARRRKPGGAA